MGYREVNKNGTMNPYVVSPYQVQPGDRYGYKIVAVIYPSNQWAAYMGLTHWDDDYVANHGDKIIKDIAEKLFPSISIDRIYNE